MERRAQTSGFGKAIGVIGLATLAIVACRKESTLITPASEQSPAARMSKAQAHVPNELLIRFKSGVSESGRGKALQAIAGTVRQHVVTKAMERAGDNRGIYRVHTPLQAIEALSKLGGISEIDYAEPNYIYTTDYVSNDPAYTNGTLWGMCTAAGTPANQFGSRAASAWTNGNIGSSNVIIGVIDQGVMYSHPDLATNCWVNPYDPVDGIDNDGNGYVDDRYGWDFANNDNTVFDGTDNHGTHVAGTVGGKGGNGDGVAGVCWNVQMIAAKFLAPSGTTLNAILAVDYITDLKNRHSLNIVATNNSWGGGGFSQLLKDAIDRSNAQNILFVAAAGNAGWDTDVSPCYPASYNCPNVISVASITASGTLSSFSNYGLTTVHIAAPGTNVYSTLPATQTIVSGKGKKQTFTTVTVPGYGYMNGTSMAAPHVTGAAVLYASKYPGSNAAAIKAAILNNATPTAAMSGKCVSGGRLNVSNF